MMRRLGTIFFASLLLGSSLALAQDEMSVSFLGGRTVTLHINPSEHWVISKDCVDSEGALKDCQASNALKALKPVGDGKLPFLSYRRALCQSKQGKVIVGRTDKGSEVQICLFPDGSSVTTNSLYSALRP